MKLQILLAMMLLTVVAFAQTNDSANTAVDSSATNDTTMSVVDVTTNSNTIDGGVTQEANEGPGSVMQTSDDLNQTVSTGDSLVMDAENSDADVMADESEPTLTMEDTSAETGSDESSASRGSCDIEQETERGITTVSVECLVNLPDPCHTLEYGWIPGADDSSYIFLVHVKRRPSTVCAQVVQETKISTKQTFAREGLNLDYAIKYVPTKELAGVARGAVQMPVKDKTDCDFEAATIKRNLERLEQQLERAKKANLDADAERFQVMIREAKQNLESFSCVKEVITKELPTASLCAKQRIDAEARLRDIYLTLEEARNDNDTSSVLELERKIKSLKTELVGMPTIDRCAQATNPETGRKIGVNNDKLGQFAKRLRNFNIIMKIANPCDKLTYLDDEINSLEGSLAEASNDEAAAIKEKIGSLVDIKSNMAKACDVLKNNINCAGAVQMRDDFNTFVDDVKAGDVKGVKFTNDAKDLIAKFTRLQSACLDDVKTMFDNHPCMGARVLELEVERMSSTGESQDILEDIYDKMGDYKEACLNGEILSQVKARVQNNFQKADEADKNADDVAKLVGELELRKHLILADEKLSSTEKDNLVSKLETEKTALIKDTIAQFKRAKISSSMKVRLGKDAFKVDDAEFSEDNLTLELPTSSGSLEVKKLNDGVELRGKRARIKAKAELTFENGKLTLKGRDIQLPDDVLKAIGATQGDLNLSDDGTNATYEGTVKRQLKLFAIIPLNADVFIKANASSGKLLEQRAPWWAVFAV